MSNSLQRGASGIGAILLSAFIGIGAGIGGFTFLYARGASYLSNDPAACANCHIMSAQYRGWLGSSHRAVAGCNDCHTPADPIGKYATKASNGFWHSFYFTMGGFHEPIQIGRRNQEIAEASCRKCHADVVSAIDTTHPSGEELSCIRCHGAVGHPR